MRLIKNIYNALSCLLLLIVLCSCQSPKGETKKIRPNILFCIADDASFPHMGAYGTSWIKTPAFDSVATNGLLFNNAYTPNAKCAPSRACILTGRNSWQLEEAANHACYFPLKFKSIIETLGENGYHAGYTEKGWAPGIALDEEGNRRSLTGKKYSDIKLTPPTTGISTADYAANFSQFLDDKPKDNPFIFWYGSREPHRRFEFMSGAKKGKKEIDEIEKLFSFYPENDSIRHDILDYAYEIEYFDMHLGRMLEDLEDRGELDNTIVIVTADNGMAFPRIKGQAYELSNHLPLAIMWGKGIVNPGRVIDEYVSFTDFAPTFMDVSGVDFDKSGMSEMEGASLVNVFEDKEARQKRAHMLIGKERHDVGRPDDVGYPIRGIVKGDYLYLMNYKNDRWPSGDPFTGYLNCDGSPTKTVILNSWPEEKEFWKMSFGKRFKEELYNIKEDAECTDNLIDNPELSETLASMKSTMIEQLKLQQDPRILGNGEIFDNYSYTSRSHVDFYNRYMGGECMEAKWVNKSDFDTRSFE
ncbi:sulfatase family protein [Flagellimonas marina]|uniref:Sulfatase n=1 Tax=Flagellimonas marina TaxID=1775168 RepID=A0ABV8PPZ1_9FLAO